MTSSLRRAGPWRLSPGTTLCSGRAPTLGTPVASSAGSAAGTVAVMASGEKTPEHKETGRSQWAGSWLGGVRSAGVDLGAPGERLGLPESGSGAAASYGRRLVALFIDWALSMVIA